MGLSKLVKKILDKMPIIAYGRPHYWETGSEIIDGEKIIVAYHRNSNSSYRRLNGSCMFGSPHYFASELIDVSGEKILQARHEKEGPFGLYRSDGSLAYGGLHYLLLDFIEVNDKKLLRAIHEKDGDWAYYNPDGSYAFGSPHHYMQEPMEINGEKIVHAQHERSGQWAYYRADGSMAFGGKHHFTKDFIDIEGEKTLLVYSGQGKSDLYYCSDNSCFFEKSHLLYFRPLLPTLKKLEVDKHFFKVYNFLNRFLAEEQDENKKEKVFIVLRDTIKSIVDRNYDDASAQKSELKTALASIPKHVLRHLDEYLNLNCRGGA